MNTLTRPYNEAQNAPNPAQSDNFPVAFRVFKALLLCAPAALLTVFVAFEVGSALPSASNPQRGFLVGGTALLIFLPQLAWSLEFHRAWHRVAVGLRMAVVLVFLAGILDRVSGLGALPAGTAEVAACSLAILGFLNASQQRAFQTEQANPA